MAIRARASQRPRFRPGRRGNLRLDRCRSGSSHGLRKMNRLTAHMRRSGFQPATEGPVNRLRQQPPWLAASPVRRSRAVARLATAEAGPYVLTCFILLVFAPGARVVAQNDDSGWQIPENAASE